MSFNNTGSFPAQIVPSQKKLALETNYLDFTGTTTGNLQRLDVLYLDSDGLHVMNGIEISVSETAPAREITFTNENTIILGTLLVITVILIMIYPIGTIFIITVLYLILVVYNSFKIK